MLEKLKELYEALDNCDDEKIRHNIEIEIAFCEEKLAKWAMDFDYSILTGENKCENY